MNALRQCSKPTCSDEAVATMTFNQADHMVVIGPLATRATPYSYDLCLKHVERFTPPVGWQIVRLQTTFDPAPTPTSVADPEALVKALHTPAHDERSEDIPDTPVPASSEPEAEIAPVIELGIRRGQQDASTRAHTIEYGPFSSETHQED